jgi:hypothetical protein
VTRWPETHGGAIHGIGRSQPPPRIGIILVSLSTLDGLIVHTSVGVNQGLVGVSHAVATSHRTEAGAIRGLPENRYVDLMKLPDMIPETSTANDCSLRKDTWV